LRQVDADSLAQGLELALLLLYPLGELGAGLRHLGDLLLESGELASLGEDPADREARQILLLPLESERDVLVQRRDPPAAAKGLALKPRLLLGERLGARSLLEQLELGLAEVLPQQERALLQGVDDTVGVRLDQRRNPVDPFHGHLHFLRYLRSPARPSLYPSDCSCLISAGAIVRLPDAWSSTS
jgi:hypothetical protein